MPKYVIWEILYVLLAEFPPARLPREPPFPWQPPSVADAFITATTTFIVAANFIAETDFITAFI